MINAKEEFLEEIKDKEVLCAIVNNFILKCEYTENEFEQFLHKLDFKYNDRLGSQRLSGIVWYKDGAWSERFGAEYWEYRKCPEIFKGCNV